MLRHSKIGISNGQSHNATASITDVASVSRSALLPDVRVVLGLVIILLSLLVLIGDGL